MCRRNQFLGIILTALGAGMLLAVILGAGFFAAVFGVAFVALGIILLRSGR